MNKLLSLLLMPFCCIHLHAQQTKIYILDAVSKRPIHHVAIMDMRGGYLGDTTVDGVVQCVNNKVVGDSICLSHITYENCFAAVNKQVACDTILLKHQPYILPDVVVSAAKSDYTLMHMYYRSYQFADNQLLYFADGMVDYFVPNKGKKLRFCVYEHRTYKNQGVYDALGFGYNGVQMKSYGPVDFLYHKHYPALDASVIHKEIDGSKLTTQYDDLAPDTIKKYNFFGTRIITKKAIVTEVLLADQNVGDWSRTNMKSYRYESSSDFKRKKDTHYINFKSIKELYVLRNKKITNKERKVITKKAKKMYKVCNDYDQVEGYNIGNAQWLDFGKNNLPEIPASVSRMFGNELKIKKK